MSAPPTTTTTLPSQPSLSTNLTTKSSLSLLYRTLRILIRPLRPRLVKPGKPLPAGSPRLSNHPKSKNGCNVIERKDEETGLWLYSFSPQSRQHSSSRDSSSSRHVVLYFAGGGFQSPPASEHWAFVSGLASDPKLESKYDFIIVSYPLAPNSPACDSIPLLRKHLTAVCQTASIQHGKVSLMGDSAGGNVVLSLGLWYAEELSRNITSTQRLSSGDGDDEERTIVGTALAATDTTKDEVESGLLESLIVISPAVDLRNTNPAIKEADRHDPVLSESLIEQTAQAWSSPSPSATSSSSPMDLRLAPWVSPMLYPDSTFQAVRKLGMKIHGVFGTNDVLAPDAELFRQKCSDNLVEGEWLVWKQQMHCFVLAGVYGMKEGKEGMVWITDLLAKS